MHGFSTRGEIFLLKEIVIVDSVLTGQAANLNIEFVVIYAIFYSIHLSFLLEKKPAIYHQSQTMKLQIYMVLTLMVILSVTPPNLSYRILGIFPTFSKSHYITGGALMRGLAAAGHEVSVISPFPQDIPIPNYRDIKVLGIVEASERKYSAIGL